MKHFRAQELQPLFHVKDCLFGHEYVLLLEFIQADGKRVGAGGKREK
jgi:hypothetical protein